MHLSALIGTSVRRINRPTRVETSPFVTLARAYSTYPTEGSGPQADLDLLYRVTDDLPGDWTFTPASVVDPDSVRFFQKTRVFALQHFIRLLIARHRFSHALETGAVEEEVQAAIGQINTRKYLISARLIVQRRLE